MTTTADSARPVVRRRPRRWGSRNRHDYLVFLGFAAPNILLIAAFTYRPLLSNVYYSTLNWTLGAATATQTASAIGCPSAPMTG